MHLKKNGLHGWVIRRKPWLHQNGSFWPGKESTRPMMRSTSSLLANTEVGWLCFGLCELHIHRELGQTWWQHECSILSENTEGKFALSPSLAGKSEGCAGPSQSPGLRISEPLWGAFTGTWGTMWANKESHPQLPQNTSHCHVNGGNTLRTKGRKGFDQGHLILINDIKQFLPLFS